MPTLIAAMEKRLEGVVDTLKRDYHPEKIILYGSLARGKVHRWSDIDLVVIKKTTQRFLDRLEETSRLVNDRGGVDVLVYTPAEVRRMLADRPSFFREEILKKGRVLYERRT